MTLRRNAQRPQPTAAPRRQWGADRRTEPMSAVPRVPGDSAVAIGRLAVAMTATAWAALVTITIVHEVAHGRRRPPSPLEAFLFLIFVSLLAGSALAFMTARIGFYSRVRRHRRIARATIDAFYAERHPRLRVLVPSYQEEERVIRNTLISAALQSYPDLEVVLLIDDPPEPKYAPQRALLDQARRMPELISAMLAEPSARFCAALDRYELAGERREYASAWELRQLAGEFAFACAWLKRTQGDLEVVDHADRFLAKHILGRLLTDFSLTHAALRSASEALDARVEETRVHTLYQQLAWTFTAHVASFERKRYVSLAHDPNKAMNLNSFIGLMGSNYREVVKPEGRVLEPAADGDIHIPDCDYVLTLDADSVVLPDYCARLVYEMEQPRCADVGVCQSPYSAYPGAPTRLERIAGATTDLQHITHQGMTFHNATFWVGANAILRKRALDQIVEIEYLGDWPIRRYVRDRTVIEDSESTIDLAIHGWRLVNHPERLAYSSTPVDFGSLCIQRHRWANGGLLILPKLWRLVGARRARGERTSFGEIAMRVNYLASVFWSSLALLFVLAFRVDGRLLSPLVLVVALPYFATMALDLRYCGYKSLDVLRIYAFNLILLPVNLSAAASSIVQALTGSKGQFRRTPKVGNRTRPPVAYVVLPFALVAVSLYTLQRAAAAHLWGDAIFAAANAILSAYAIVAFIGLAEALGDIVRAILSCLYVTAPAHRAGAGAPASAPASPPLRPWERVLYFGSPDDAAQVDFGLDAVAAGHDLPSSAGRRRHSASDGQTPLATATPTHVPQPGTTS